MLEKMMKYRWVWIPAAMLVAAVAITVLMLSGIVPTPAPAVQAVPTLATQAGQIEPDTAFVLKGSAGMSEEQLRAQVTLEPAQLYALVAGSGEQPDWVLTPARPFAPGSTATVRVGLMPVSFKVAPTLLVTSVYPTNGSRDVRVRSGLELQLNVEGLPASVLQQALSITPPLKFDLGYDDGGKRYSIYTNDPMAEDTLYTVKLEGLEWEGYTMREPYSFSFRTISAQAERLSSLFSIRDSNAYNTLTDESPILQAYFDETVTNPTLEVTLFSYPNVERYKADIVADMTNSYGKSGATAFDTASLTQYTTFTTQPVALPGEDAYSRGSSMVVFPQALPAGWYLAQLSYDTGEQDANGESYILHRYQLIQSSDLSVFFMHSGDDLLLWANDAATGLPAQGAQLVMEGDLSTTVAAVTGADGTALVRQETLLAQGWQQNGIFTITHGGRSFVDARFFGRGYDEVHPSTLYTSALFTDRPLYQTTDTVRVWGMIRPRRDSIAMPKTLALELEGADAQTITPNANGTFTAEISIAGLAGYGGARINLMADGEALTSEFVRIYDFVKPTYVVQAETDRPVYLYGRAGATPQIKIQVETFDGNPIPAFRGTVSSDTWGYSYVVLPNDSSFTTDASGSAVLQTKGIDCTIQSWDPVQLPLYLQSKGAENESPVASLYVNVIPRDLMLQTKTEFVAQTATVTVQANRVDISRITSEEQLYGADAQKLLQGNPLAMQLTAELISTNYVQTQTGVAYDYINRVSVPVYRHEKVEKTEKTFTLTTDASGSYAINNLPAYNGTTSYRLILSGKDSAGLTVTSTTWLYPEYSYGYGDSNAYRYSLERVIDPARALALTSGEQSPGLWELKNKFSDGEAATFHLNKNDVPVSTMQGRMLYATVQRDIENATITEKDTVTIPFAEDLLPNYILAGAYFDGKHIFALSTNHLSFDPAKRELAIALDAGKETFAPQEQATITATVTEAATGKPAADAEVVLAVVDEAIFALQPQYVTLLSDLYQNVFYPVVNLYTSFQSNDFAGAGEKGGGGGDDTIREEFPDTALFATATTNHDGKASFTVTMPDSMTSWRMTALALTKQNYAGNTKQNVVVTKDFYVTPLLNTELLQGDDLVVGLRSLGHSVQQQDSVRYTVTVEGTGESQTAEIETAALRDYGWATFTGLPAGDYTVTMRGSCKDYTDTIKLPISILPSGIEVNRFKTVEPAQGLEVASLRWPVSITLYDQHYAGYNEVLRAVRRVSYGMRTDMRLARSYTDALYARADKTGARYGSGAGMEELSYGELKMFEKDAEPNMRLMAIARMVLPQGYNPGYNAWSETGGGPAQSYQLRQPGAFYMLCAVEGNLTKGQKIDTAGFTVVDTLDLATAYAIAGETDKAQKTYNELVKPSLKSETGLSGLQVLYLPERDGISKHDMTAAASRLASVLGNADADGLALYLINRESRYDTYIMEKLLYLKYKEQAAQANPARVSYVLSGERVEQTLDSTFTGFSLSKAQLAALQLKVLSGKVFADIGYTAAPDDLTEETRKLGITKKVEPVTGTGFAAGDIVKITLTPDLAGMARDVGNAELVIDDYLPAGMRFEKCEPQTGNVVRWQLLSRNNQRLRFTADVDSGILVPVVYYARCVTPGSYTVESAYISSGAGDVWGSSDRTTVAIAP